MCMDFRIRLAVLADAGGACEVVRRSITELCAEDHRGDQATIAAWLSNKTADMFERWIGADASIAVVAEGPPGVVGFGLMNRQGQLALLYVSPDARFRGVSKALLQFIEREAKRAGIREITLASTATASRFYAACGFARAGEPVPGFGNTQAYPMHKMVAL